jgi:hypothetical protein
MAKCSVCIVFILRSEGLDGRVARLSGYYRMPGVSARCRRDLNGMRNVRPTVAGTTLPRRGSDP